MPPTTPTSTHDKVTLVATITNIILTLLIAFFGYLISSDVRDIQKHADQRAKAKEVQEFWGEMRHASQKLDEQSKQFGRSLAKFTTAAGQLMDEYDRIYRSGRLDSLSSDLEYLAAYATYIGAYGEVSASVASVGNEYAFLRVRYAATAATHSVAGWSHFASQDKDVSVWITEVQTQLDTIARSINSVVTEGKNPTPMEQAFSTAFARLGSFLATKPIPYARSLAQFLDANWKPQSAVATHQ